jgi:DNA-binding NtrC family response regulator
VGLEGVGDPATLALVVAPGTPAERRVPVGERPIRIGSDADADLRLDDQHVSRRHAEVRRTAEGLVVRDLGSRNGTLVDDVKVKEALLADGAVLTLGRTRIRVESAEAAAVPAGPTRFGGAVGDSPAMRHVFATLERLAGADVAVTLRGEPGTGKELLARALHAAGPRASAPFVVAQDVLAEGGTVYLDGVDRLSADAQARLARALERSTARVVAGAGRDLEALARAGKLREDLCARLSVAVVPIPPLRARLADLPVLCAALLGGRGLTVSRATLDVLAAYAWPGNVDELAGALAAAAALADGKVLEPRHLVLFQSRRRGATVDDLPLAGRSLESLEKAAIEQTLRQVGGNKTRAAKALGIAPSTLYEKLKKYGLS